MIAWDDTTKELYLIGVVKIDKPTIIFLDRARLANTDGKKEGYKGTVRTEELRP